jgi:hypothetical protein
MIIFKILPTKKKLLINGLGEETKIITVSEPNSIFSNLEKEGVVNLQPPCDLKQG